MKIRFGLSQMNCLKRLAGRGQAAGVTGLLLPLLLLPLAVQAQDYSWATNNGTITLTAYQGAGGVVSIPDLIDGLPVTDIGDMGRLPTPMA